MRRREVLALRWADLDLDAYQLEVVQQLALERGRPVLKQLKTESSDRVVTFGPTTAAVLAAHRERQRDEEAFVGPAWQQSGLVFTTALGWFPDLDSDLDRLLACDNVMRENPHYVPPEARP